MVWGMALGLGMSVAGGIIGGNAANQKEQAQYQAELAQHNWQSLQGRLSTEQQNRQIAQSNAARRYRNHVIAKNANAQRAFQEGSLKASRNVQMNNIANAYRFTTNGARASMVARGTQRGGTADALKNLMRTRNLKEIVAIAEQARIAERDIIGQQQSALAQRDFSQDEYAVFYEGAGPVYQGSSANVAAGILSGVTSGLSIASSLTSLGGKASPTTSGGRQSTVTRIGGGQTNPKADAK